MILLVDCAGWIELLHLMQLVLQLFYELLFHDLFYALLGAATEASSVVLRLSGSQDSE